MNRIPVRRRLATALMTTTLTVLAVAGPAAAQPIPPSDPFYAIPANLAAAANGSVIDSRSIDLLGVPLPVRAWQVKYKSLDAEDRPTTGVTTIVTPVTPWTGPGARPLISHQLAEDSLGTECAPSFALARGSAARFNNGNVEAPLAVLALRQNWAVAFPDYQGPQARFLDKDQAAHSVLDSLRAARSFAPAGLGSSPLGLTGFSGGSLASVWAAQAQPGYAPELPLAGVAVGGVPYGLDDTVGHVSGTTNAGLGFLVLAAMHRLSPAADIPALLNGEGKRMLAETANYCGFDFLRNYLFADVDDFTIDPDIGTEPRIRAIARQIDVDAATPPTTPTYFWHSTEDDVLPIEAADQLAASWCRAGAELTYVRTSDSAHALSGVAGFPAALDYLGQRFAGATAPTQCG
ncbi:lipase family protein [Nocardia sp. XZ_19_385]|uniref:lipase family protein n=1 Tax=Nocardia sp. XZ_19_385 TaxID=2769488 RepID=UPI00188ED246|nr:lipase family protein [Nocardia sp. XZ_19_385]